MINAEEALKISEDTLSEGVKSSIQMEVEKRIRAVAAEGQTSLKIEGLTDAQKNYLRVLLTQSKFQLSDVGLTIYW